MIPDLSYPYWWSICMGQAMSDGSEAVWFWGPGIATRKGKFNCHLTNLPKKVWEREVKQNLNFYLVITVCNSVHFSVLSVSVWTTQLTAVSANSDRQGDSCLMNGSNTGWTHIEQTLLSERNPGLAGLRSWLTSATLRNSEILVIRVRNFL